LAVALHHLRNHCFPDYKSIVDPGILIKVTAGLGGFGDQAVTVFFVISGWLVGGQLLDRQPTKQTIYNYAIDRITRLWTVLLPLFVITFLGMIAIDESLAAVLENNGFSLLTLTGNLFGLQTIVVPNFANNYPLWSLSNETWYYILFPLLVVALSERSSSFWRLVCMTFALALSIWLPGKHLQYFSVWLLGALFSRLQLPFSPLWTGFSLLVAVLTIRISHANGTFLAHLLLAIAFAVFLSSAKRPIAKRAFFFVNSLKGFAKWSSGLSFSLYVIHVPVIYFLQRHIESHLGKTILDQADILDWGIFALMWIVILGCAHWFYFLFESRTQAIRNFARRALQFRR
jgi:peptidoglycan/LPS O-acetylase OafA/YrhL